MISRKGNIKPPNSMCNILIFGNGLQSLSLARGIKERSSRVYNMGKQRGIGMYSKYIDKYLPFSIETIEINWLIGVLNNLAIDLIIPTEDEYAEWLSNNKEVIESNTKAKCAIVDPELFRKVINKNLLISECEKANVPCPFTRQITLDKIDEIGHEVGFPALLKPDISNGARGIKLINDLKALREEFPKLSEQYGDYSLQEYIHQPSHYYNVMIYRYKDGSFSPYVATKITRFYPIRGGSSSFCTTIINEQLAETCKRLLDHLGWEGFADFDVLEKREGDYRIIEINPRIPASLHAALVSGINFGEIICKDLLKSEKITSPYVPGEQLRFLGLGIAWFIASPNRFKAKPSWFKFFGKHLHYQEGGSKDFKAMLFSLYEGVKKQLSPEFRKAKSGMN